MIPGQVPNPIYGSTDVLNTMGFIENSRVNGPGCRAVLWLQGCVRACPGCFNPSSWSFEANQLRSVEDILTQILANPQHDGVTFSGGEPFWQAKALAKLAQQVKAQGLTVMSFSGFTLAELQSEQAPPGSQDLLAQLDILVDGPFVESLATHDPECPVASRNQHVHVFNPDLQSSINWASNQVEIHILKDGTRIITGYYQGFTEDL